MSLANLKNWLLLGLASCLLVACGGGGSAGTPVLGGGGGTAAPTLTVSVSSASVTPQSPATVTVTVRDAAGKPISGAVVAMSTVRGGVGQLSASSLLTDNLGMGSVGLSAVSSGVAGADEVLAVANLGTTTLEARVGFSVTASTATLQASVDSTTLRVSTGPVRFSAVVRNSAGSPVAGEIVTFGSASGQVRFSVLSTLTDAAGVATTTVVPADGSASVADTLLASATVNGKTIQSAVNVQVVAESISVVITLVGGQTVSSSSPVTVLATVQDATNQPVAGAIVNFSTQFGLGSFSAQTAATAANTGTATVVLSPKTPSTSGADNVVASVTVNGVNKAAQRVVEFVPGAPAAGAKVQVGISSSTVTPQASATVTLTALDSTGKPVAGTVVSLATARGNLGVLSASSVLTGANGTASVQLSASPAGLVGADEVIADVVINGQRVQGTVGFSVQANVPTIAMSLAPGGTLRVSSGPATLSATVKDAGGNGVPNQVVQFSSVGDLLKLGAPSAMTNATGVATVTVLPNDASVTAADTLVAASAHAGIAVRGTLTVQMLADTPSIKTTASNSIVTVAAPVTLTTSVKDTNGAPVAGAIVAFSTQFDLTTLDAPSVVTNAGGTASVTITPKSTSSNGADVIVASTAVGGVAVTSRTSLQVVNTGVSGTPVLAMTLSSSSISSANPATVTATLSDAKGQAVAGQVVTFSVVRGLARTNVATALTNSAGAAVVILAPSTSSTAGADEVTASASFGGTSLQATSGFQVQSTNVLLTGFTSAVPSLGAYAQTFLTVTLSGASVGSPVNVGVTSSCVAQNKATLSPSTFTATTSTVVLQYKDAGCGAVQSADQLQATIVGSASSQALSLPIAQPAASTLAFVQALPEVIYLKGSGFAETSTVTFEVRDGAGNTLPNRNVVLSLLTRTGGATIDGGTVDVTRASDAAGRVSVRVNSGTVPSPIRIAASLAGEPAISTVSSNLSVAVGLPSQLNFSLSQQTINIEGYDIDGTPNAYNIFAADRSSNPVPAGTSINFVAEGGQVEAIRQTQMVNGIARTSANFVSAEPRPVDGRVTVTAYALGEESFIDQNGNNTWDPGEPFQDLGNVIKDRIFDGAWDPVVDEFVPLQINNSSACTAPGNALLAIDTSIPTMPGTCDSTWSGPGKVYVRRAVETVLSTSSARTLWANTSRLDSSCRKITLQNGPLPSMTGTYTLLAGDTWYASGTVGSLSFLAADANPIRLNPMAAGTTVTASTTTKDFRVAALGSPVPSTSEVSAAAVTFDFGPESPGEGVVVLTFTSPSGLASAYSITVRKNSSPPTVCPP